MGLLSSWGQEAQSSAQQHLSSSKKGVVTWDQQVVQEKYYRDVQNPLCHYGSRGETTRSHQKWPGVRNENHGITEHSGLEGARKDHRVQLFKWVARRGQTPNLGIISTVLQPTEVRGKVCYCLSTSQNSMRC